MAEDELPISLASFLILGVLPRLMEKDWLGRQYILLGRVLVLSVWLYETGAVLGRFWKDRLPKVVEMFEVEDKRKDFTEYWCNQAKKRLEKYGGQPNSFPIFVAKTDLEMYTGEKLEGLLKIGNKKLHHEEAQKWLRWVETSLIEGIMFGSLFPELTNTILSNEYEKISIDSWKEARKYGLTLSEEPPRTSLVDKEKEALLMARDYVAEYHPELVGDLGLAEI